MKTQRSKWSWSEYQHIVGGNIQQNRKTGGMMECANEIFCVQNKLLLPILKILPISITHTNSQKIID